MTALIFAWALSGLGSCMITVVIFMTAVCHPPRPWLIHTRHLPNALDAEDGL
jgi:hypothetical protein